MKFKYKKIIAREFLILMSCIGIFILAFIGTNLYNFVISIRVGNIEKKIESLDKKIDSLENIYGTKIEKQKWFYNEFFYRFIIDRSCSSYENLWNRISELQKSDSIVFLWNNIWSSEVKKDFHKIGFKDEKEINQFVLSNSLNEKEQNFKRDADSISFEILFLTQHKLDTKDKHLDSEEQIRFSYISILIIGIIVFPARLLIYSIRWSVNTLKQKD